MTLPSVTYDRIRELLEAQDFNYHVDDDGEYGIGFEDLIVWVNTNDKVLRLYAFWRGNSESTEDAKKMIYFAHSLNSKMTVPKTVAYGDGSPDSPAKLSFEYSVPVMNGLSESQLQVHFALALQGFFRCTALAAEEFPHLVTWSTEEGEA